MPPAPSSGLPHRGRAAAWLRALVAAAGLAAVLVGVPYGLWTLGTLPASVPSWEHARKVLLSPDDGTLLVTVLTLIGWACWLALVWAIVVETAALIGNRTARRRTGLAGLQQAAAWLVGSLVLLSTPAVSAAATATPAVAATLTPTTPEASASPGDAAPSSAPARDRYAEPTHTVTAGNPTLWGIAEERLGDGTRWKDILALNPELQHAEGDLPAGTVLKMPSDTPATRAAKPSSKDTPAAPAGAQRAEGHHSGGEQQNQGEDERYVVAPGDTLSGIADEELGEAARYPEIFQANRDKIEDPDLIYPGQVFAIPSNAEHGGADHRDEHDQAPHDQPAPDQESQSPSPAPPAPDHHDDQGTQQDQGQERQEHATPAPDAGTAAPEEHGPQSAPERQTPAASPTAHAENDNGQAVLGIAAATGLVAAGVLGLLWGRRVVQQRRRRRGRRILMPRDRVARTEQQMRATPPPVDPTVLDAVLRTTAVHLADQDRELPALRAAVLGEKTIELVLAEPAEPVPPFTALEGERSRWACPARTADLVDPARARDVDAPYPGLVTVGTTGSQLVLADLEQLGLLHITGPARHAFARSLAVELAVTPLADDLAVTLPDLVAPGLAQYTERLTTHTGLDGVLQSLTAHHADQQQALAALGAASLRRARLGESGAGSWGPQVLFADAPETGQLQQLSAMVATEPRTATAVITTADQPAGDVAGWVLHADLDASEVQLPGTGLQCRLNILGDDAYDDIIEMLATAEAGRDVPAEPAPGYDTAAGDSVPAFLPSPAAEPDWVLEPPAAPPPDPADAVPTDGTAADDDRLLARFADLEDDTAPGQVEHQEDGLELRTPEAPGPVPTDPGAVPPLPQPEPREDTQQPASGPDRTPADGDKAPTPSGTTEGQQPPAAAAEGTVAVPEVRVLGPVEVVGTPGTAERKRVRVLTELAAWLILHPGRDHRAMDEAIWPGREVDRKLRNPYISKLRSWFGVGEDGTRYLPLITDNTDARYAFHPSVRCDWNTFQDLVRTGEHNSGPAGTKALRDALELLRGRPFAAVPAHRYVWAESLIQDMIAAIVDAAELLAERYLVAGDPRGALWAAAKGLHAAPEAEQLHRAKFQALAALGHWGELKQAALALDSFNADLGLETEDATVELLNSLLAPSR